MRPTHSPHASVHSARSLALPARTLGIVGYGAFGRFIAPHLTPNFRVVAYDPGLYAVGNDAEHEPPFPVRFGSLGDAARCDVVVLAPPVQAITDVVRDIAALVTPGALVVDVASVKVRPVEAMRSLLPATVDVVGLHPLFGPQSGRKGIRGLPIAVCPVRPTDPRRVIRFLANRLGLAVSVVTPEAHDCAMAYVQALTHFVAAAFARVGLPDTPLATPSYTHLRTAVDMVRFDAPAVYEAIQCENPYAAEVRAKFMAAIRVLDERTESPSIQHGQTQSGCPLPK